MVEASRNGQLFSHRETLFNNQISLLLVSTASAHPRETDPSSEEVRKKIRKMQHNSKEIDTRRFLFLSEVFSICLRLQPFKFSRHLFFGPRPPHLMTGVVPRPAAYRHAYRIHSSCCESLLCISTLKNHPAILWRRSFKRNYSAVRYVFQPGSSPSSCLLSW